VGRSGGWSGCQVRPKLRPAVISANANCGRGWRRT
jgi:hypothetical protein